MEEQVSLTCVFAASEIHIFDPVIFENPEELFPGAASYSEPGRCGNSVSRAAQVSAVCRLDVHPDEICSELSPHPVTSDCDLSF